MLLILIWQITTKPFCKSYLNLLVSSAAKFGLVWNLMSYQLRVLSSEMFRDIPEDELWVDVSLKEFYVGWSQGKWMVGCVRGSVTVEVMGPNVGWLVCTLKPQHLSTYVIGTPILKWMLHTCTDKPSHFITNPNTSKLAIHRQIHIAAASLLKVNTIKQQAARCGIHGSTSSSCSREPGEHSKP